MKIDLESGTILGAMESPGHQLTVAQTGDIYVASLTGNVFKRQPNPDWPRAAAMRREQSWQLMAWDPEIFLNPQTSARGRRWSCWRVCRFTRLAA